MTWLNKIVEVAKANLGSVFPALGAVDAAREYISEAVAQRIRDEACARAYALLAQTQRSVVRTIVWQNAALLLSIIPVYFLHSPVPFYIAYACVACYSVYSVAKHWLLIQCFLKTRSVTETLSKEVLAAIESELTKRQFYERKVIDWLGPELKKIADEVAIKLKPDVLTAAAMMAITLLLAFVAFRLFAIPMLEHKALFG